MGGVGSHLGRGIVTGLCGTQALDWVGILLYDNESAATREAEDRARHHRHAYEVAVDRIARRLGRRLDDDQITRWGWRFHKFFGIASGLGYLALRRAFPRLRAGYGLAFGVVFFMLQPADGKDQVGSGKDENGSDQNSILTLARNSRRARSRLIGNAGAS